MLVRQRAEVRDAAVEAALVLAHEPVELALPRDEQPRQAQPRRRLRIRRQLEGRQQVLHGLVVREATDIRKGEVPRRAALHCLRAVLRRCGRRTLGDGGGCGAARHVAAGSLLWLQPPRLRLRLRLRLRMSLSKHLAEPPHSGQREALARGRPRAKVGGHAARGDDARALVVAPPRPRRVQSAQRLHVLERRLAVEEDVVKGGVDVRVALQEELLERRVVHPPELGHGKRGVDGERREAGDRHGRRRRRARHPVETGYAECVEHEEVWIGDEKDVGTPFREQTLDAREVERVH